MEDVLNVGFTDLFEVYPIQQHSHTGVQYSYLEKRTTASGRVTFNSNSERLHLIKVSDPNLQLLQCALVKEHTWDHVGFCFRAHTTIREGYNYQARLITEVERVEPGLETLYKLSLERLPFITPSGHTSNSVMLVGWFVKWDEIMDDRAASAVHNFNSLLSLLRGTENDAAPFLFRGSSSPGGHSIPAGVHLFVSRVFDIGKPDSNRPKNRPKQESSLGVTKSSSGRVSKHTTYNSKLTEGLLASQQAAQNASRNSPVSTSSAVPVKHQYNPPILRPQNSVQQPASPKHSRESDIQYGGYNKLLQQQQREQQQQQQQREQQQREQQQREQQQREQQQREQQQQQSLAESRLQQLRNRDALLQQRSSTAYNQPMHAGQLYAHHTLQPSSLHHTSMGLPPAGYPAAEQMLQNHYAAPHALWPPVTSEQVPGTLQHAVLHPVPSRSTDTPSPTSMPSGKDGKGSGATSSLTTTNSGGVNLPLNLAGRPSSSPASPIAPVDPYSSTSNSFNSYPPLPGDGSPHVRMDHHLATLEDAYLTYHTAGELDMEALVAHEALLRQQQMQSQNALHPYLPGRTSPTLGAGLVPSDYATFPSLKSDLDSDVLYDSISNPTFVNVRSVPRRHKSSPVITPQKPAVFVEKQVEKPVTTPPRRPVSPAVIEPVSKSKPLAESTFAGSVSPPATATQLLPGMQCYHQVAAPRTPVVTSPQHVMMAPVSPMPTPAQAVVGIPVSAGPAVMPYAAVSPPPVPPTQMVMVMSPAHCAAAVHQCMPAHLPSSLACCPAPTHCASPLQYITAPQMPCAYASSVQAPRKSLDTVEDYKALTGYVMPTPQGNPESDIDPSDSPEGIVSSSDESITCRTRLACTVSPCGRTPTSGYPCTQLLPRLMSHNISTFAPSATDTHSIELYTIHGVPGKPLAMHSSAAGKLVGGKAPPGRDSKADSNTYPLSKYLTSHPIKPEASVVTAPLTPCKQPLGVVDEDDELEEFFDASEDMNGAQQEELGKSPDKGAKAAKHDLISTVTDGIPASYDPLWPGEPQLCESPRWFSHAKAWAEAGDVIPEVLICSAPDLHLDGNGLGADSEARTADETVEQALVAKLREQVPSDDPFKPRLIRSTSFASRISRYWSAAMSSATRKAQQPTHAIKAPASTSTAADASFTLAQALAPVLTTPQQALPTNTTPPGLQDKRHAHPQAGQQTTAHGVRAEALGPVAKQQGCEEKASSPTRGAVINPKFGQVAKFEQVASSRRPSPVVKTVPGSWQSVEVAAPASNAISAAALQQLKLRVLRCSATRRKILQDSGTIQDAKMMGVEGQALFSTDTYTADYEQGMHDEERTGSAVSGPARESMAVVATEKAGEAEDVADVRMAVEALVPTEVRDKKAVERAKKGSRSGRSQEQAVPEGIGAAGQARKVSRSHRELAIACKSHDVLKGIENR